MNTLNDQPQDICEFDRILKLLHESTHDEKIIVQEYKTKYLDEYTR